MTDGSHPDDGRAERALGVGWALLASLTVLVSLTAYSVDASLPAFPEASDALGTPASAMQLTLTGFLLGIAGGQLVFGPLSDRLGRRGPLLVGAAVCVVAGVVAASAPTIEVLLAARVVQGFAGSAGAVLSKAIVRDRTAGAQTVRALTFTAVGSGLLNVFAPSIGSVMLAQFGWRGPFWFVAALSAVLFVVLLVVVPETHPPHRRDERRGDVLGLGSILRHLRNRPFVLYVVLQASAYGTLMSYVAASPFVYRNVVGVDPVLYGFLFSANALLSVTCNFLANRYLRRLGSRALVALGLGISLAGITGTAIALGIQAPPVVVAVGITLSMATIGLNFPNLVGLALNQVSSSTGAAAATIGFVQFCTGAVVAPVVGLAGDSSAAPMLLTMALLATTALTVLGVSEHRGRRGPGARVP